MSNRQRVNFGFKQINQQRNQLKTKPNEFLDYDDETYTDFSQQNKKRMRE
jgi:hypothetical protein